MRSWSKMATMLWWVALVCPAWVCPLAAGDEYANGVRGYELVELVPKKSTKETYTEFLEALRKQLASDYKRHEIPVLRGFNDVSAGEEEFLLVKLTNDAGKSITVALDITCVNVVAYQAEQQSFFLSDAPESAFSDLFIRTEKKKLAFGGDYAELEKTAAAIRQSINIGMLPLDEAITSLYGGSSTPANILARSFIVISQMVSEAVRFRYIEQQVRFSIRKDGYRSFLPDFAMIELENNWERLSTEIQGSYQKAFSNTVQLRRANGEVFSTDSVSAILKTTLALLKFACRSEEPTSVLTSSSDQGIIIRPHRAGDQNYATCKSHEPTAKIVGRKGLCVVSRNQDFSDGNRLILWDCGINHFWTFKRDGTIRSVRNDKCLTTYNFGPESYVMTYNCSTAPKSTTLWVVDTDGSIINPVSGLSLSAETENFDITLTADKTIYASRQGWLPTNFTQPFAASIVGQANDLCLKTKGNNLVLQDCLDRGIGREWTVFSDGTLRTSGKCLTCNNPFKGSEAIIMECAPSGWSNQRWVFNSDGTIMNPKSGLVLEVKNSDTTGQQVVITSSTGNPNQKWLLLL